MSMGVVELLQLHGGVALLPICLLWGVLPLWWEGAAVCWHGHIVFVLEKAHPCGRACFSLCIAYCHLDGDDPKMQWLSFSWTSQLPQSCHCSGVSWWGCLVCKAPLCGEHVECLSGELWSSIWPEDVRDCCMKCNVAMRWCVEVLFPIGIMPGQSVWQSTMIKNCLPPYVQKSAATSWNGHNGLGLKIAGSLWFDGRWSWQSWHEVMTLSMSLSMSLSMPGQYTIKRARCLVRTIRWCDLWRSANTLALMVLGINRRHP